MSDLSGEDIKALDYMGSQYGRSFKLGQYEQGYTIMDYLENGTYMLGDTYMGMYDPVWGEATIGDKPHDAVLLELARTPLFRRSQAIEQLTLGPDHATIPNSMYFSRWQHLWGSLAFVRKMTEGDPRFSDRERTVLGLRTLVSDLGHTAFSHLGDWLFQGIDGGEDMHDEELKQILDTTGISAILEKHGFSTDEVAFPDTEDWVECPSPDLCVDRVDYSLRELVRWGNSFLRLGDYKAALAKPKTLFEINDDLKLVIKNEQFAKTFAAGFAILPTEHWGHPVHRLQLQLLESAVKSVLVENVAMLGEHPRDAMYGIDADFRGYFAAWDTHHLDKMMKDIAFSQRLIFASARRADLEKVFQTYRMGDDDWRFPAFPDPLESYTWQSKEHAGPYAAQVEVEPASISLTGLRAVASGIEVSLPPLKARSIDPLVRSNGQDTPLSCLDPSYENFLAGQKGVMGRGYTATILVRTAVAQLVEQKYESIQNTWADALKRRRDITNLERRVREAGPYAAAYSFDYIREVDDEDIIAQFKQTPPKNVSTP